MPRPVDRTATLDDIMFGFLNPDRTYVVVADPSLPLFEVWHGVELVAEVDRFADAIEWAHDWAGLIARLHSIGHLPHGFTAWRDTPAREPQQ